MGDVNGDAIPDLVVGTSSQVEVRLGLGDGTFADSVNYLAAGKKLFALADLNGDERLDLVAGLQDEVSVLLNIGEGVFEPAHVVDMAGIQAIAVAKMNADDYPDLITGSFEQEGPNVQIWSGVGDGSFLAAPLTYETVVAPLDFAVADLNADSYSDLVVGHSGTFHHPITNNGPGGVSVLMGLEAGGLQPSVRIATPGAIDLSVEDGSEIVAFRRSGNTVARFEWVEQTLSASADSFTPVGKGFQFSKTGDFDNNGQADVVVADLLTAKMSVYFAEATGGFSQTQFDVPATPIFGGLLVGDFNGDGIDDIAMEGFQADQRVIGSIISNGNQTFKAYAKSELPGTFDMYRIGDLNEDGIDDLVGVDQTEGGIGIRAALGNSDGKWDAQPSVNVSGGFLSEVVLVDANADGKLDVVAIDGESLQLALGDGTGQFEIPSRLIWQAFFTDFGDISGDGILDVVAGSFGATQIRVAHGTSEGTFVPASGELFVESVESLSTMDIDGDGVAEIIVGSQTGFQIFSEIEGDYLKVGEYELGFRLGSTRSSNISGSEYLIWSYRPA